MILYFSGTGNSAYVAGYLSRKLGEDYVMITDVAPSDLEFSGDSLIFVFPVYSWGVPPIMLDYIRNLSESFIIASSGKPAYVICVCGDETALAPEMIKKSLETRGFLYHGGWSVQMPNNYVILPGFNVDSKTVEQDKIAAAPERLDFICNSILEKGNSISADTEVTEDYVRGNNPRLKSKMIYPLFKKWGIAPSKWHFTEECIGCGRCVSACPVKNIRFSNGRPKWDNNCTSCLACYHICPAHAVHYGKATRHKGQYLFPGYKRH